MKKKNGNEIGFDARFRNPIREKAFREWELASAAPVLRSLVVALGFVFFAFAIPDLLVYGPGGAFALAFALRLLFLALSLAVALRMRKSSPLRVREIELAVLTLGGIAIFGLELYLYGNDNAYLEAMSVMLMIMAVFLLPNRLGFSFIVTLILAVEGSLCVLLRRPSLPVAASLGIMADYLICVGLATASSWRTGKARRQEYLRAEELQSLSRTDLLTGLPNRRAFEEQLGDAISRASRHGEAASLIMIDLDRFKDVNDQYGHEVGDSVLVEFAERLVGALRLADRPARWGGEEFAVVLPLTGLAEAVELAERLRCVVDEEAFEGAGKLSASFGVTLIQAEDELARVVLRADRALYSAKRQGRNRVASE